ncbi:MAG: 16S rRNA (adenine(1518)-N(6)/adenine(1519)-N(6))-dimethyltransferase RsmA [Veillonellaceae bacterium]|nr:16S rRNA (adenine(1518)-N(6)/adenine(1519)-N(6))-dimethyltransferase RsmA [Veillonellaceae bacterium]
MTEPIIAQREVTRHILNRFGIRTQKKLGQHFLVDETVVRRIAESLELKANMPVLEIGPGIGTLTQFLAMTGACVTAVELDRRCIEIMGTTLRAYENVHIVQGDVLTLDFAELMGAGPFQIVGNLPYYITTPIVMKILEGNVPAEKMVFMVQKEVADRMVSAPGSKEYGALSVAVQYHTEAVKLFEVPSAAFMPPPAVDSAVILCTKRAQPPVDVPSAKLFFRVVRAAFGQRRKTLANSLQGGGFAKEEVIAMLQETGIKGERRGETLSLEEFAALSRSYARNRKEGVSDET